MLIQQFSLMMTEKDEQNFVIDDSHQTCSALLVEKSEMVIMFIPILKQGSKTFIYHVG
jgi:hypothetical protein